MDKEKLIKELEKICDYTMPPHEFRVLNDVLVLLKEQENVSKRNHVIVCPHCGKRVK